MHTNTKGVGLNVDMESVTWLSRVRDEEMLHLQITAQYRRGKECFRGNKAVATSIEDVRTASEGS